MKITASDGTMEDTLTIAIDVQILNNNLPVLSFGGLSSAIFVEGSIIPLAVGQIFQPNIFDDDNNDIFLMERATVKLEGTSDGYDEILDVDSMETELIEGLGITIQRKLIIMFVGHILEKLL